MRKRFAKKLHHWMSKDKNIYVLCGDVGYSVLDKIFTDFPDRIINCGASEQVMVDMAVGLALDGKIPVVYTITPFLLYRPFESIRLYLNMERIPVKLVGSGRDKDYFYIGITHFSDDDRDVMALFDRITSYWPQSDRDVSKIMRQFLYSKKPSYMNLSR